ncbi:MAG: dihydrofolate reductase [Deltaproteobacteria bacterium]|nr:dihydrofolate reductase [Deltaproteobacteria bacterium]MBW2359642.1 dihydrofolate reductase [Deltaproteobacteria bacterium]
MSDELGLIAAVARNGVIGRDGGLPWRLPEDLKHFQRTTLGNCLIMGRMTWESLPAALPGRRCVVVSRDRAYRAEGAEVVANLDAALTAAHAVPGERAIVAGGAQIYALALPRAQRMWLTRVDAEVEGDVLFPAWGAAEWERVAAVECAADARHAHAFCIEEWVRISALTP